MKDTLIMCSVLILILFSTFILIYVGFLYKQINSLILGFFQLFLLIIYFYFYFDNQKKKEITDNLDD